MLGKEPIGQSARPVCPIPYNMTAGCIFGIQKVSVILENLIGLYGSFIAYDRIVGGVKGAYGHALQPFHIGFIDSAANGNRRRKFVGISGDDVPCSVAAHGYARNIERGFIYGILFNYLV